MKLYAMTEGVDAPDPVEITLEAAAKHFGFVLVPADRLLLVTGARQFATDTNGTVHLPMEHVRRSVANELASQIAPQLKLEEKWDGYRLRTYTASVQFVLPAAVKGDDRGDGERDSREAAAK